MTDILRLRKSNCRNCYKCIRNCPVKSIRFSGNQAHIVGEDCILCGRCFVVCPQNAKEVRDDTETARTLIQSGSPVVVSLAPSYAANYEGVSIEALKSALISLGFSSVEETALGATMVKKEYEHILSEGKRDVLISSCCPTVNLLIRKYFPEVIPSLAPVVTPAEAHCCDIKRRIPSAKTVFIGPCISKKAEARDEDKHIDCVLTFEELSGWLEKEHIVLPLSSDEKPIGRARSFPTSGGIIASMDKPEGYDYLSVDGIDYCISALRDIRNGVMGKCFIEMSACSGSCVGGPVMDKDKRNPVADYLAVRRVTGKEDLDIGGYDSAGLGITRAGIYSEKDEPTEEEIREVLRQIGKNSPEDELNCGSCGYDSCREKAKAVCLGKADLSMCLPYLKERAQSLSDSIIANTPNGILLVNDELEVQQINEAAQKIMNIRHPGDVLGEQVVRILDPASFIKAKNEKHSIARHRVFLAEYEKFVDETIIYDPSYHTLTCIMSDVTEEENAREKKEALGRKSIEITDRVIEKQMRAVQEIASLLGETTAETKLALTKLKETMKDE